jgi:hypothetical protein
MRSLIPAVLMILPWCFGHAQDTVKENPCRRIGLYEVRSISLPHRARLHDTLTIGLRVITDCVMKVTRVDTSIRKNRITFSVYGTYWKDNCPRPLCPAREVTYPFTIRPRSPGTLRILVRNPGGRNLTASTKVRRGSS